MKGLQNAIHAAAKETGVDLRLRTVAAIARAVLDLLDSGRADITSRVPADTDTGRGQ
jgi:hypothetical protein